MATIHQTWDGIQIDGETNGWYNLIEEPMAVSFYEKSWQTQLENISAILQEPSEQENEIPGVYNLRKPINDNGKKGEDQP